MGFQILRGERAILWVVRPVEEHSESLLWCMQQKINNGISTTAAADGTTAAGSSATVWSVSYYIVPLWKIAPPPCEAASSKLQLSVAVRCPDSRCSAACDPCDTVDVRSAGRCRRTTSLGLWQQRRKLSRVDCVTSHKRAVCRRVVPRLRRYCRCCRNRRRLSHGKRWQVCVCWWHRLDGNWRWTVINTNNDHYFDYYLMFCFIILLLLVLYCCLDDEIQMCVNEYFVMASVPRQCFASC